ncbi:MAG: hypothetical protein ABFD50_06905 [Smithella sp.]
MKIKKLLVVLLLCLMPVISYAQEIDPLEQAYKEQYIESKKEIESLQALDQIYSGCIQKNDLINSKITNIYEEYKAGRIWKRDTIAPKIALEEERLIVLNEALRAFNNAKGEHRSDISIDEIKRDQEFNRKRIKELIDKKRELKIKVLEKKGSLPSWWID